MGPARRCRHPTVMEGRCRLLLVLRAVVKGAVAVAVLWLVLGLVLGLVLLLLLLLVMMLTLVIDFRSLLQCTHTSSGSCSCCHPAASLRAQRRLPSAK